MATLVTTPIKTFVSGETVTPTKLNELSQSTVALTAGTIVAADIASDAVTDVKIASGVDASKLTTGTLPIARIADAAVTAAKLDGAQTGSAPIYGCRAWVNFDGTSVTNVGGEDRCTIRASGNVSKVVRNSTGTYTVHFATAMQDANYCVSASCSGAAGNNGLAAPFSAGTSTTQQIVTTIADSAFVANVSSAHVAIFR